MPAAGSEWQRPSNRSIPSHVLTFSHFTSRERLFSRNMWKTLDGYSAYDDLALPRERLRRWHPLNQSLYLAYKVMLPGLLLAAKGDRPMHNASTEGRYPFLDEAVVAFCARLDPRLKVRRLTDKRVLRILGQKILPPSIANRHKIMFRAHMSSTFLGPDRPAWVFMPVDARAFTCSRLGLGTGCDCRRGKRPHGARCPRGVS